MSNTAVADLWLSLAVVAARLRSISFQDVMRSFPLPPEEQALLHALIAARIRVLILLTISAIGRWLDA